MEFNERGGIGGVSIGGMGGLQPPPPPPPRGCGDPPAIRNGVWRVGGDPSVATLQCNRGFSAQQGGMDVGRPNASVRPSNAVWNRRCLNRLLGHRQLSARVPARPLVQLWRGVPAAVPAAAAAAAAERRRWPVPRRESTLLLQAGVRDVPSRRHIRPAHDGGRLCTLRRGRRSADHPSRVPSPGPVRRRL